MLRRLARATGGEAFFPSRKNGIVAICERIARDIRSQYTIGYVSGNAMQADGYRCIRVDVRTRGYGKLSLRARFGYMAGSESRPVKDASAKT